MRNIYTGIDFASDGIKIVVSEIINNKFYILASTSTDFKSSGIRKGIIVDRQKTVESLNEAIKNIEWDACAAEKDGFEDYMLKEIHEQPKAVRDTLAGKIILNKEISFDNIKFTKNDLDKFDKIYITGTMSVVNNIDLYFQ